MSREDKLRKIADLEQALMREVYGFDAGVAWAEARIIKLLTRLWEKTQGTDIPAVVVLPDAIALIKGKAE